MKAIILARVSTEEQKEAGNSLPAQIHRLEEYCRRKGLEIVETFSFDESAYKTKRDEFDKIVDYLNASKEKLAVCFDKVDRLSRNVFDTRVSRLYEKAVAGEIELHFVSDGQIINNTMSAGQKTHFGMNLVMSKYYSDAISDNVKRAYEQKLRNGEWIGKGPLGYKNITREDGKKDIVFDEDRSFFVKKIFEMYSSGDYSMKALSLFMQEAGLTNRTGKLVSTSQIEQILKNPFYYGMMRTKGELYKHKYEPLITFNLFTKVRNVIDGYNKANFKRTNKPYVFRGLITCANCGCLITPELKKGKHIYYHCTNYHRKCNKPLWLKEERILAKIEPILQGLKLTNDALEKIKTELIAIHDTETQDYEKKAAFARKEIAQTQNNIKVMYQDRLDLRITPEEYDKTVIEYKERLHTLQEKHQEYEEADEKYKITLNKVLDLSSRAYEIFMGSEPQEKTQLLNFLLQNAQLDKENLLFKLKDPFSGVLEYGSSSLRLRRQDSNL